MIFKNFKNTINQAIREALGMPKKSAQAQASRQSHSSINNLQDKAGQNTQKSRIYLKIKAQGIKQGQTSLILRLLKRRIGEIESNDEVRINQLSVEQLGVLGEALLDFSSRDDLVVWLNR